MHIFVTKFYSEVLRKLNIILQTKSYCVVAKKKHKGQDYTCASGSNCSETAVLVQCKIDVTSNFFINKNHNCDYLLDIFSCQLDNFVDINLFEIRFDICHTSSTDLFDIDQFHSDCRWGRMVSLMIIWVKLQANSVHKVRSKESFILYCHFDSWAMLIQINKLLVVLLIEIHN